MGRIDERDLLKAAEDAGFAVLVTADKNLSYQQNLQGRRLAMLVLSTNDWRTLRENSQSVAEAVDASKPRGFHFVSIKPRPPRDSTD